MSDIVEFLKARLVEDERRIEDLEKAAIRRFGGIPQYRNLIDTPERARREVAAKRELIEYDEGGQCGFSDNGECLHCDLLPILAAVYSDHPDYRAEWEQ